jgi:probable FeS assembly SUF system protein SufT
MLKAIIELSRDCDAVLIPSGEKLVLKKGTPVAVSQALGGTFTVITDEGSLARISGVDADAIGEKPAPALAKTASDAPLEKRVWDVLRTVYDPEIPVDVVELGLIYGVDILPAPAAGGSRVLVRMTLTAPGCGIGDVLKDEVEQKLSSLEGVGEAEVEWAWDPPWDPSRMSEAAKLETGLM